MTPASVTHPEHCAATNTRRASVASCWHHPLQPCPSAHRCSAFSPASGTPYASAHSMMCCSSACGLHRPSGGCSQSRISTHVKLSRASNLDSSAMIESYLRAWARSEDASKPQQSVQLSKTR